MDKNNAAPTACTVLQTDKKVYIAAHQALNTSKIVCPTYTNVEDMVSKLLHTSVEDYLESEAQVTIQDTRPWIFSAWHTLSRAGKRVMPARLLSA